MAVIRVSSGRRHFRPRERVVQPVGSFMSSLLLLFVLVQQYSSLCSAYSAYSLSDFLAAYNNPRVHIHEVKGNVVLTASLPPLTKAFKLVGKAQGGSRPSIDGASRYTGIRTDGNITVTLENLEFKNFRTEGNGAVLEAVSAQAVVINRCAFTNNQGTGRRSDGGALFFESTDFKITSSQFYGNRASNGGAISSSMEGPGSIRDTVFEDNRARGSGGALASLKVGGFEITGCRFTKNKSRFFGGAVWFSRDSVTLSSTQFVGNVAGTFGGAIRFYADNVDSEGNLYVCRGNSFASNRAGKAASNNISVLVTVDGRPVPAAFFCERRPAGTLLVPANGIARSTCRFC